MKQLVDVLIDDGTILTVDGDRRILEGGSLAIAGDRIVALGKASELRLEYEARKVMSARDKLVMPGLINGHSHFIEPCRGLIPDNLSTRDWLKDWAYPYLATLTAEDEYWHALNIMAEMIRSGTTCFVEPGCKFLGSTIQAVEDTGMRCAMGRWTWDQAGPDAERCFPGLSRQTVEEALRSTEEAIQKYDRMAQGRIRIFATLEGAGTCSDGLMIGAKGLADRYGVYMLMHLAGSRQEVESEVMSTGQRPLERLHTMGLLAPNLWLNHMVWVDNDEIEMLAEHDVKVSHNPSAALKLGKGVTQAGKFLEMMNAGVIVALGCDSSNGSDFRDMVRAMHLAATLPKDARMEPAAMTAEKALEMATIDGARALGWHRDIGSLEVGKKADVILLDMKRPEWVPTYNIVYSLVYSATGDSVDTVLVDGRVLMEGRKLQTIDEEAVIDRVQRLRGEILAKAGLRVQSRWKVV